LFKSILKLFKYSSKHFVRAIIISLLLVIIVPTVSSQGCWYLKYRKELTCDFKDIPDKFFTKNQYFYAKHLLLGKKNIEKLENHTFDGLTGLERLDLKDNKISNLSDGVFEPLVSIKAIDLSNNKLTSIGFDQFSSNQNLKNLHLEFNYINIIHPVHHDGGFNLTTLWLNHNMLVDISELCKVESLTFLDLSDNPYLNFGSINFNCWNELTDLQLENTNLASLKNDYRSFTGLRKLNHLNLSRNNLTMFCSVNFPELLLLEYLSITYNQLQKLNGVELITKFKNMKKIDMFGNPWDCKFLDESHNLMLMNLTMLASELECYNYTEQMTESFGCKLPANPAATGNFFGIFVICAFIVSITIATIYWKFL
jgi:Leucine-rich repeat (LRR) protein